MILNQDVDGIPKMTNSTPKSFFDHLEAEGSNLCRWVGELYLELHNGTYTSQVTFCVTFKLGKT